MNTGIIKRRGEEGYGFIEISEDLRRELGIPPDRDLFFHASGVAHNRFATLHPGDEVSFEIHRGRQRGPEAHNVKLIARAA